jgi:AcrR family transcriptional regulator
MNPKRNTDISSIIEQNAIQEFSRHSYKDSSLSRIARNSGIPTSNLYLHFESKQQLYTKSLQQIEKSRICYIQSYMNRNSNLSEQLTNILKTGTFYNVKYPIHCLFFENCMIETHPDVSHLKDNLKLSIYQIIKTAFLEANQREEVKSDIDILTTAILNVKDYFFYKYGIDIIQQIKEKNSLSVIKEEHIIYFINQLVTSIVSGVGSCKNIESHSKNLH